MSSEVEPVEVEAPPKPRVPEAEPVVAPEPPRRSEGALFDTGMGAGMGAASAPTLLRHLARRPPEDRKAGIDDLNERAGNRHVARMIMRRELGDDPDPTPADVAATRAGDADALAKALRTKDPSDIKAVRDFSSATVAEREEFITILMNDGWVLSPAEYALERLWNSFGTQGIVDIVGRSSDMWDKCVEYGMDPSNIAAVRPLRAEFEKDVKAIAKGYMAENLEFAKGEMARLGVDQSGVQSPTAELERSIAMEEVQELARGAEELLATKDRMKLLHVGYRNDPGPMDSVVETPVDFDPEDKPHYRTSDNGIKAPHEWATVKAQWDAADAALAGITAQNPTVFAALSQGREHLQSLGGDDPQAAHATATKVLHKLKANIEATIPKIDSGDLDWMDLAPIHQQLFHGKRGPSGMPWDEQLPKSVAKDVVGDHETSEFWESLLLGSAAGALFIVASLATGGLATAALLGGLVVSGGQAVASWERYEDLATAAKGTASEQTRLVSEGQVDAAMVQAILDTIFAALDFGQARGIYKGIQAGARLAEALAKNSAEAVLEAGMKEGGAGAAKAIERSVAELGAEATARRTGKGADELVAALPLNSPARQRILAARDLIDAAAKEGVVDLAKIEARAATAVSTDAVENAWRGQRSIGELLQDIPGAIADKTITKDFADDLVLEAIEAMGPANVLKRLGGWKKAAQVLGDESAAAKPFMQWRNSVFEDLEDYVIITLKGDVQRTGTVKKFSNDIDMSFIGPNAAEARDGASKYLAARLGVPNDPGSFDRIMMAGLFTDPRRMHAYDGIPDVLREQIARTQAHKQESLIWNRRLYEAVAEKDEALTAHIREQMSTMSIAEFAYKPMTPADISRLSKRVDSLHAELEQAVKAGDTAKQAQLATDIGDAQALINATESGGYFSGGGVRRFVSERPGEKQFPRLEGGANQAVPQIERVGALVDQLFHLDHSALKLGGSTESVISGIRGIGKYGDRFLTVAGEGGGGLAGKFDELATECLRLKEAAEKGATTMTAEEANKLASDAARAFGQLQDASAKVLADARAAANMTTIGNEMEIVMQAVEIHTKILRAKDVTVRHITKLARAVQAGKKLSEIDGEPDAPPAPNQSHPDQNQSIDPSLAPSAK